MSHRDIDDKPLSPLISVTSCPKLPCPHSSSFLLLQSTCTCVFVCPSGSDFPLSSFPFVNGISLLQSFRTPALSLSFAFHKPWHRLIVSLASALLFDIGAQSYGISCAALFHAVMDSQRNEQEPLLQDQDDLNQQQSLDEFSIYARQRRKCRGLLISKQKHYLILALVALDVSCLLADIFIALIDCDKRIKNDAWVPAVREGLEDAGLIFSCLFMLELIMCLWAFGFE